MNTKSVIFLALIAALGDRYASAHTATNRLSGTEYRPRVERAKQVQRHHKNKTVRKDAAETGLRQIYSEAASTPKAESNYMKTTLYHTAELPGINGSINSSESFPYWPNYEPTTLNIHKGNKYEEISPQ
jgi:hypothetical protein